MSESAAVFQARALEIGIEQTDLDTLKLQHAPTFGQYAFICPFSPSLLDETPLKNALSTLLGAEPDAANMIAFRKLYFESHAIAVSAMKSARTRLDKCHWPKGC